MSLPFHDRSKEMDEKSWWDLWNTSYRSEDTLDPTSTELFEHVTALIDASPNDRILEVACGTGTLSRQIAFSSYHGLDISPAAIEVASAKAQQVVLRNGMQRPTYEVADFHDWPVPAGSFDSVVIVDAIACVRDQALTLRKIAQGLRKGGRVLLTTVNPFVYNRIRRAGGVRLENGPVSHWLTRSELHDLVRQAGLKLERSYTIMPRGEMGILRIINSRKLNHSFGPAVAQVLRRLKERVGLGQYRIVIARKDAVA